MILFPFKVGPGETVPVAGYGKFVYYESGTAGGADYSIVVKAQGSSGVDYVLKVGQGFRTSDQYSQLVITNNKGAGTITGVLVLADEGFFDNRVVGTVDISGIVSVTGTVAVVDGGKSRSAAGSAFIGMQQCVPGGVQPNVELWNPVGSGKSVILSRITMSVSVSNTTIRGYLTQTRLATLAGNGVAKNPTMPAAAAEIRSENTAAGLTKLVMGYDVIGNAPYTYVTSEPIILAPGYGLVLRTVQANGDLTATFEWIEE